MAWEHDVVGLLDKMRVEGVLVEVALSSAEGILGVHGDAHPFRFYSAAGVPICLTTDDEGVNRSNLTMEYVKATMRYELDYEALKALSRNCLEYAFVAGDSLFIERDLAAVRPDFAAFRRVPGPPPRRDAHRCTHTRSSGFRSRSSARSSSSSRPCRPVSAKYGGSEAARGAARGASGGVPGN